MASLDDVTFLGPSIPLEVRRSLPLIQILPESMFRKPILATLHTLFSPIDYQPSEKEMSDQQALDEALTQAAEEGKKKLVSATKKTGGAAMEEVETALREGVLATLVSGLYTILRAALRSKLKDDAFTEQLGFLGLPPTIVTMLVSALSSKRSMYEGKEMSQENRLQQPHVADCRWRVDVTITTSSLLRVFRPSVLMQMTLSDGRVKQFEVPIKQLHDLRYQVAQVLKDFQSLEAHPIMKIKS